MKPKIYFFTLLGMLVLAVAGGAAGYYYTTKMLTERSNDYKAVSAQQSAVADQLDQVIALKKQFLTLQPKLANVELALPKTKDQSELALQLQQISNASGMNISNISFSTSTTEALPSATSQTIRVGEASALPVSFQLTGTYDQLKAFLQRQEQLNRYTNVTSLTINQNQANQATLSFNIVLNAFVKP